MAEFTMIELVVFDPADAETYPSVCHFADEVRDRFGFVGGETLAFDTHGAYLGQVEFKKTLGETLR